MRENTRSEFIVLEFGTKRPRVRIPPLRHNNPGCPLWVSRVIAIRNDGERTRGRRGKGEKRSPGGGIAEGDSDSSLLARNERRARSKREQRRLSERYRIPPLRLPGTL